MQRAVRANAKPGARIPDEVRPTTICPTACVGSGPRGQIFKGILASARTGRARRPVRGAIRLRGC